jgi:hypothetical protein
MTSDAYAGALDFRHKFLKNTYEISGSLDYSRVRADARAMRDSAAERRALLQRPDADLPLDTNRTLLTGDAEELSIGKVGGKHFMFNSAYSRARPASR